MLREHLGIFGVSAVCACGSASPRGDAGEDSGISSVSLTADDGTGADDGATGAGTGSGSQSDGDGTADDGVDDGDGDGAKFDVGSPDGGALPCDGGMGDGETHSYIWIANSSQGTVSKINTQTVLEEARYIVRPDSAGNPSRTSVALSGNVAVANRSGGVVKIFANIADCQESNGMAGIQTSGGAADVLPWDVEECRAWYTSFTYTTQRPVAWAHGDLNPATCKYENEKLWSAGGWNAGVAEVVLLDGDTGVVEQTVMIPNVIGWAQLYGGAVDGDGNFWTVDHNWSGPSTLIRVNRADFSYDTWPVTGGVHYGMTVDPEGRAWLCGSGGASRFDPGPETWTHLASNGQPSALGGCMTDGQGTLWHSPYPDASLVGIDTETVTIVQTIPIPAYVHGISIDFDGYVWGVEFGGTRAFRVDPVAQSVDTYDGLVGAYTYSDMTGFALSSVGAPSG
jgi:hypothetical protein